MGEYLPLLGIVAFLLVVGTIGAVDIALARRRERRRGADPADLPGPPRAQPPTQAQ